MFEVLSDVLRDAISKFDEYIGVSKVYEAICMIDEASNLTRREGLLALEDAFARGNSKTVLDDIAFGIMLIVDGTEPEILTEILVNDYWANKYEDNDALKQYVLMRGILSIQQGENPRVITEILMSTLPRELRIECSTIVEEARNKRKHVNDKKNLKWFKEEYQPILTGDAEVKDLVAEVEADIKELNKDKMLSFMMRVEPQDIVIALATCSKEVQEILVNNMSRRLFYLSLNDLKLNYGEIEQDRDGVLSTLRRLLRIVCIV